MEGVTLVGISPFTELNMKGSYVFPFHYFVIFADLVTPGFCSVRDVSYVLGRVIILMVFNKCISLSQIVHVVNYLDLIMNKYGLAVIKDRNFGMQCSV